MYDSIQNQIQSSFKWSAVTEIIVKIISPVLNAILAHLLSPDDYAPLATITMLISFCEIFVESGFKKYLIQHDFKDEEEQKIAFHVAFWTTLGFALFLWALIIIFCKPISAFLGNSEIWLAVALSGSILPMYAMTGIFSASIQKQLAFKKLFSVRVIAAMIPLIVTIPLALLGWNYWALVIGNIASVAAQMVALKIQSKYKIRFCYSLNLLKTMFSDTMWTLADGVAVWLTAWVDSLIITQVMSAYYLGLYKNSLSTVTNLFSIVSAAVVPVMYVGLTKFQNDNREFSRLFVKTQQTLGMLLIPMGAGVFWYSDFAVMILFGDKWTEASSVVAITAITLSLRTVYVSICSDAYRAKGWFKLPLFLQVADLMILVPTCLISAQYGFKTLVYARALARLALIIPETICLKKLLQIDLKEQISLQYPIWIATGVMSLCCFFLRSLHSGIVWDFASIILAVVVYVLMLCVFPATRNQIKAIMKKRGNRQ